MKKITVLDRILLLCTGLLAAYQIAFGIDGLNTFILISYMVAFGVLLVAGHPICSRKHHKLVMPARLPNKFAIAISREIAVIRQHRKTERSVDSGRLIAVPIKWCSMIDGHQIEIAQAICKDRFRPGEKPVLPLSPQIGWQGTPRLVINRTGVKARSVQSSRRIARRPGKEVGRDAYEITSVPQCASHSPRKFRRAHRPQPPVVPVEALHDARRLPLQSREVYEVIAALALAGEDVGA